MAEKIRIVLIEDDQDDSSFMNDAIASLNIPFSLSVFNDGVSALSYFDSAADNHPDIIFLDLNLPFMNGIEVMKNIKRKEILSDIPLIIYSTSDFKQHIITCFEQGADYYIVKPSDFESVKNKMRWILENFSNEEYKSLSYIERFNILNSGCDVRVEKNRVA
jgi:DNA-binding response OmpR family regulator